MSKSQAFFLQKFDQKLSPNFEETQPENQKLKNTRFYADEYFRKLLKTANFGHKIDKNRPPSCKKANCCEKFHQISHFLLKIASKTHIFSKTQAKFVKNSAKFFKNSAPKMQKLKNTKFYAV